MTHCYSSGEKPYVCSICGESFTQLQGINAHKRAHKFQKSKPKVKDEAKSDGEESTGGSEKKKHKMNDDSKDSTENGDQPSLNCRFCGRSCKTLRTLTNHESIHTSGISKNSYKYFMEVKEKEFVGEKQHACEICNEKFAFRNSLSYHRRKFHRMFMW